MLANSLRSKSMILVVEFEWKYSKRGEIFGGFFLFSIHEKSCIYKVYFKVTNDILIIVLQNEIKKL